MESQPKGRGDIDVHERMQNVVVYVSMYIVRSTERFLYPRLTSVVRDTFHELRFTRLRLRSPQTLSSYLSAS